MKNYVLNMAKDYSALAKMSTKWFKNYWLGILVMYGIIYGAIYVSVPSYYKLRYGL